MENSIVTLISLTNSLFHTFPENLQSILEKVLSFPVNLKLELENLKNFQGTNRLNSSSSLIKDSFVGKNVYIGDFTLIRDSYICEGCKIGSHVEINHSIVLKNAVIPHHNYTGYSIIGNNVILGGNTRTAVRRLDNKNPNIVINGAKYKSELKKFGSIIGDGSKIGSSVVLNPITILGREVVVEPNVTICGFFPNNSHLKNMNLLRGK